MPETVYSENDEDDYEVHHPEPECGYRQRIERLGNDKQGVVGNQIQDRSYAVGVAKSKLAPLRGMIGGGRGVEGR